MIFWIKGDEMFLNNYLMNILEDPRLCYSIREQICVGVWPNPKNFESRGFAKNLYVKSRCVDASKYFLILPKIQKYNQSLLKAS